MVRVVAVGNAMESYQDFVCLEPTFNYITNTVRDTDCLRHPEIYKYPVFSQVPADNNEYYLTVPGTLTRTGAALTLTQPSDDIWIHAKMFVGGTADYYPEPGTQAICTVLDFINTNGQSVVRIEQTVDEDANIIEHRLYAGPYSEPIALPIGAVFDIDIHFAHQNFAIYIDGVFQTLTHGATYPLTTAIERVLFHDTQRVMYRNMKYKYVIIGLDPLFDYEAYTVWPSARDTFVDDWAPSDGANEFVDRREAHNLVPESSVIAHYDAAAQTFKFPHTATPNGVVATQLNAVFYGGMNTRSAVAFTESRGENLTDLSNTYTVNTGPTHVKFITDTPLDPNDEEASIGFVLEQS